MWFVVGNYAQGLVLQLYHPPPETGNHAKYTIKKENRQLYKTHNQKIQQVNLHDAPGKVAVTCTELQYNSNLNKSKN